MIILFSLLLSSLFAVETVFERDTRLPLVHLSVAIKGGSTLDPEKKHGLTRFTGEMMLRGTLQRSKDQIAKELDEMGATLDIEARTEALIFRGSVLAKNFDRFAAFFKDILSKPSFPETQIKKLADETVSEILESKSEDSYLSRMYFRKILYGTHPYAFDPLGSASNVRSLDKADLIGHYNQLFRDRQFIVAGSGDLDPDKVNEWSQSLAKMRPGGGTAKPVSQPPLNGSRQLIIVDKPNRTQVWIRAGQTSVKLTHPDYFPLFIGNEAFGGDLTSARLNQEIRVKRGWSYGANSMISPGSASNTWQFVLYPATKDAHSALKKAVELVEELKGRGITQLEFESAKRALINRAAFQFNTPQKRVENAIMERIYGLPSGFYQSFESKLSVVTLPQVNAALSRHLSPEKMAFAIVATRSDVESEFSKSLGIPQGKAQVVNYTED